jgi:hypothetical protein
MNAFGACVDRVGSLIVQCRVEGEPFLRFYNSAATVTGIPDADRQIRIGGSEDSLGEMAYDRGNDRLFVVVNESILVFEGAALAQNGDIAPTRSFSHPDLKGAIALGPNGDLYANAFGGVDGFGGILVFSSAGLRSGAATPDRIISLNGLNEGVPFVDSLDRLYVADSTSGDVAVLENASTRDGLIEFDTFPVIQLERLNAPGFTLLNSISSLAVDSRGIGYVAIADDGDIHIVDNIGTRSGLTRADRVIVYDSAIESGNPDAIFLWE